LSSTIYSFLFKVLSISAGAVLLVNVSGGKGEPYSEQAQEWAILADTLKDDTTRKNIDRSGSQLIMRWKDYYSNRITEPRPRSPFYLREPSNISTNITLDSAGKIAVTEKIQIPGVATPGVATPGMPTPGVATYVKLPLSRADGPRNL
jgi:hypothetical protein